MQQAIKHKPQDVLKQLLLCPVDEIPEYDEDCIKQTRQKMDHIINGMKALMKSRK